MNDQNEKNQNCEWYTNYILFLNSSLQVRTKTWTRDSHGLFDYENNNQVKSLSLYIESNGSLIRRKNDTVEFIQSEIENNFDIRELGKFQNLNSTYLYTYLFTDKFFIQSKLERNMPVNNQTLTDLQEKIWYVVKTNNSNMSVINSNNSYLSHYKYELKKNDIIKLGRIKFLIKDINICEGSYVSLEETFKSYEECE